MCLQTKHSEASEVASGPEYREMKRSLKDVDRINRVTASLNPGVSMLISEEEGFLHLLTYLGGSVAYSSRTR